MGVQPGEGTGEGTGRRGWLNGSGTWGTTAHLGGGSPYSVCVGLMYCLGTKDSLKLRVREYVTNTMMGN